MTRQRMLPALTTAAVAVGLVLIAAAPAAAHNYIVSSTPAEGDVLTAMPNEWIITTNDNLLDLSGQGSGFAFLVADSEGLYYGDGCVTVQGPAMTMPAALGGAGDYVMTYQFVSADGHTLSGQLPFTWQAPDDFEPHIGLAEPPVCGETASAPAPAPEPSPTAEPEATDEAEAAPDATDPDGSDADGTPVPFFGIALAVVLLGGIIVAIVLVARARRQRAERSNGDAPVVVGDGGSTSRAHTEPDADGSWGGDGGGGGGD